MKTCEVNGIRVMETPWITRALIWVVFELIIMPSAWIWVKAWEHLGVTIISAFVIFQVFWCGLLPFWLLPVLGGVAVLFVAVLLIFSIFTAKDDHLDTYD